MSEQKRLTVERLVELRRVAEVATPGPLIVHPCDDAQYAAFVDAPHLGPDAPELAVFLTESDARFFAEFDRDTVLAMLDEIERLRREHETLVAAVRAMRYFFDADYSDPEESAALNWSYAYQKWSEALDLLDGEIAR